MYLVTNYFEFSIYTFSDSETNNISYVFIYFQGNINFTTFLEWCLFMFLHLKHNHNITNIRLLNINKIWDNCIYLYFV